MSQHSGTEEPASPAHDHDSAGSGSGGSGSAASEHTASEPSAIGVPVAQLPTLRVMRWGMACWVIALLVVLVVPALREQDRWWWVWVPVAGLVGGAIGHLYLTRGRGNAADA